MLKLQDISLQLSKRFEISNLNVEVLEGDHIAVIGESGCGKTSLLKMIYGLYDLDHGAITWKNQSITGPADNLIPGMPFTKYLSQDFDLMPFTTVKENVHKYLSRRLPKSSNERTAELLEVVEMTAFANVKVKTLSGGQKQRVALAQTLAKEPELLLLDEPFSHIDNFRKNKLRRRLFDYLKNQHITCLVATHDSTDVLAYTDKTMVMRNGKIVAYEKTQDLYRNPPSYYVGSLFDDINELPKSWFETTTSCKEKSLLYPYQIEEKSVGIEVTVKKCYFMGSHYLISSHYNKENILFNSDRALRKGETLKIGLV